MFNPSANPALYGHSRPKSKPIPISHSSIHSLSTELSLAKQRLTSSSSTSTTQPGRPRGEKTKSLFSASNKGVSSRAARDLLSADNYEDDSNKRRKIASSGGSGLTDAELARSKRKMEEKSKFYEKLRRGKATSSTSIDKSGTGGEERLVDFDRKWNDNESNSADSCSDDPSEDEYENQSTATSNEETIEYIDELGRTRTAPKSIAEKHLRKINLAQSDSTSSSATEPNPNLIYGPIIQTHAFTTATYSSLPSQLPRVEDLPHNKPEAQEKHYDANSEIRTKGVGFYAFSADNEQRKKEMAELEAARRKTEEERKKKEELKRKRKEEIEARRGEIRKRKRNVVGERWLEGFMEEMQARVGGDGDGDGVDKGAERTVEDESSGHDKEEKQEKK